MKVWETDSTCLHCCGLFKVPLWSFWSRQVGGYFLLDYSVTYLLSCCLWCCTCLMFDCVMKVVDLLVGHKQSKQISTGFARLGFAASISIAISNSSARKL